MFDNLKQRSSRYIPLWPFSQRFRLDGQGHFGSNSHAECQPFGA
jgi:hypothetical protein